MVSMQEHFVQGENTHDHQRINREHAVEASSLQPGREAEEGHPETSDVLTPLHSTNGHGGAGATSPATLVEEPPFLEKIDERVRSLVTTLNTLPGIYTFSSCGGHAHRQNVSQCPADEFFVNFAVESLHVAWYALWCITEAMWHTDSCADLLLEPWANGDALDFAVRGIDGADPDVLAMAIETVTAQTGCQEWLAMFDDDEEALDWDDDDGVCIRAKWRMNGARTLAEARHNLHEYAKYLEGLEQQGYELIEPIADDYGFVEKQ